MVAETAERPPMTQAQQRASFFRQSGWLMIANIGGGVMMWVVHFLNKFIGGGEYGSFVTFLSVVMILPTMPLQMVMAQQTAKLLALGKQRELSGLVRSVWWTTFLAWLVGAIVVLIFQGSILARWKMTSPVGLWVTLPIVLLSLWLPMFWGVLQGRQNFLWLGWTMIISAVGRLSIAAVAVCLFHAGAGGMMAGVLLGIAAAVAIAAWQTRADWLARPERFDWSSVRRQIVPLGLGFLGFQIVFTADTMFVKSYFDKATVDFYGSAGTMARALMWLVLPLASVMFPRLVHSSGKAGQTNLVKMVFIGTGVLGVLGATSLSLLGPWVIRLVYKEAFVHVAASLLPWYVSAMVPLALANVLLNNLLAQPESKLSFALCVLMVAIGYIFAVTQFHETLVMVLQTLGVSNLVLLGICAWFTWGHHTSKLTADDPRSGRSGL